MDLVELAAQPGQKPSLERRHDSDLIWWPYVEWLIVSLVSRAPAQLGAELLPQSDHIEWILKDLTDFEETRLDRIHSKYFRPLLARISASFMRDCPYGGYRRFHIAWNGDEYPASFYLGNDALNGLWFRGRCGSPIETTNNAEQDRGPDHSHGLSF